jgi:hypothetical protein
MKGPICASGSRGFILKTLENNCRDRAHRNLQISDGSAALRRNASQGISAQETSACRRRRKHHHLANRCEPSRENKTGLNSNHVFFSSFYELLRRRDLCTCAREYRAVTQGQGPDRRSTARGGRRVVACHTSKSMSRSSSNVVSNQVKSSQVKSSQVSVVYV